MSNGKLLATGFVFAGLAIWAFFGIGYCLLLLAIGFFSLGVVDLLFDDTGRRRNWQWRRRP